MKKFFPIADACIVFLLMMAGCVQCVQGQTTQLSFQKVLTDLNRPGAGFNEWTGDQNIVNIPTQGTNTQRLDRYWRFTWLDFQPFNGTAGAYNFTVFDQKIQQSITNGQSFSFGVMQQCGGCDANLQGNVGGNKMQYPLWLHTLMQGESPQDFTSGGEWFPNYNSPSYLTALKNLNVAINAHILAGSFNGIAYKNVIGQIDVRGYGDYGEWTNNVFTVGNITVATGDSIISYHVHVFDKFQCVEMIAANDGGQLTSNTNVPPLVGFYGLNASNSVGRLGLRRDSWGQTDGYLDLWMGSNPTVVSGYHFDTAINNRYKYNPVVGEPQDGGSAGNFPALPGQMTQYGVTSVGNGNFNNGVNATIQNNFRAASAAAGYRILIDTGSMTTTIAAGGTYNITLKLKNTNGIPPYISWKIVYEWWNGTTLLQRDTSAFDLKGFLSTSDVAFSSTLTLRTVPAGTGYSVHVKVVDPTGYRIPMPLFNTGRLADGSYIVNSPVTVTSNSGGAVANAGPNQNISITSVNLTSALSTGAATQVWTRVSGPNSPTFVTPAGVTTSVTGLITGTYVFQVAINGGSSGQLISTVTIVVNAPPVNANAGSNQTITLPTSTVTLNGSGSTGLTTSVWTNVSGPNTPTITSAGSVSTTVTGLIAGTYVFNLSINSGASNSNVTVTVLPIPAPVANAGPSQTITLPTTPVGLDGTGSSGVITSYVWTQVSGPNTAAIATPAASQTLVTGYIAGVYVFRLTLNGVVSDTMQLVVNPAIVPPPAPSGINIFTTQAPNSGTLNDGPQGGITGIEIGVKFRVSVPGYITGIRFYKKQDTTTKHIGELYNSAGTRLAQVVFTNEGTDGWQTVQFVPAIAVVANTTYIAAIFSPSGNYVSTNNYFTGAISNLPVAGLADGTDGHNGVYKYTATAAFPNAFFQKANYWIDPYFTANNPGTVPGHFSGSTIYFQPR